MRVLLTGASGFLGSHIAEQLAAEGHDLRLLLRRTSSLAFLRDVPHERVEADVREATALASAVEGIDAVVHAAGITSALSEGEFQAVNAGGTAALAGAAAAAGVRRFVYISSLAARGPGDTGSDGGSRPISPYGRSKRAGEEAALRHAERMEVVVVRPPVIYGPRDRGLLPFYRLVKLGVMPVYGSGENLLSWVHARDAARAAVLAATAPAPAGAVYTVSDGAAYTWRELASRLAAVLGRRVRHVPVPGPLFAAAGHAAGLAGRVLRRPLPLSPGRVREMSQSLWVCGYDRIRADLGWEPTVSPDDGIAETVAWYRENRWI
jgi:nucleoside-diphosphate-sugar epimerase